MPIKGSVTVTDAVELLNAAAEADPDAIGRLMNHREWCTGNLLSVRGVQIMADPVPGKPGEYTNTRIGILGLLNGIFGEDRDGWGTIAAVFDVVCPGACEVPEGAVAGDTCRTCEARLEVGQLTGFKNLGRGDNGPLPDGAADVVQLSDHRRAIVVDDLCEAWRDFLLNSPGGLVEFGAWRDRVKEVLVGHYPDIADLDPGIERCPNPVNTDCDKLGPRVRCRQGSRPGTITLVITDADGREVERREDLIDDIGITDEAVTRPILGDVPGMDYHDSLIEGADEPTIDEVAANLSVAHPDHSFYVDRSEEVAVIACHLDREGSDGPAPMDCSCECCGCDLTEINYRRTADDAEVCADCLAALAADTGAPAQPSKAELDERIGGAIQRSAQRDDGTTAEPGHRIHLLEVQLNKADAAIAEWKSANAEQAARIERLERELANWNCSECGWHRAVDGGADTEGPDSLVVDEGGVVAIYERSAEPTSEDADG